MQIVSFAAGENRYIRLLVKAINNQPFSIRSASYELSINGVTEASGDCIIDDHILLSLISPSKTGTYKLKISYNIGDETLIEVIEVAVR